MADEIKWNIVGREELMGREAVIDRCDKSAKFLFFFNDTATTEIYTLSLHDALPIRARRRRPAASNPSGAAAPNHTVSQPCARASAAARRATDGVGSSIPVSSRTTSNSWSASNFAAPFQLDA